jgi:hypothetical protein
MPPAGELMQEQYGLDALVFLAHHEVTAASQ